MPVDGHANDVAILLRNFDFVEEEIGHEVEVFGSVVRVTSIYRFRFGTGHTAREGREVNIFHFYRDGAARKIISCFWNNEREGFSLLCSARKGH